MSRNQLESLPEAVGACAELGALFAAHNQLAAVPRSFSRLRALTSLRLEGNRLQHVPVEICAIFTVRHLPPPSSPTTLNL